MPAALEYHPPNTNDRYTLWLEAERERSDRRARYKENLDYYNGQHPKQIPVVLDDRGRVMDDDNVIVNLVKVAADRTSTFVIPSIPKVRTDLEAVEKNQWDLYLERFFKERVGLHKLTKWVLRGCLAGHTFMQISEVDGQPQVTLLDPASVVVYWAADDTSRVLWYEMPFYVGGILHIRDFYQKDGIWYIDTYKADGTSKENVLQSQLYPSPMTMGSGFSMTATAFQAMKRVDHTEFTSRFPPIIDVPHLPDPNNYYGLSEFGAKNLQDAINKLASIRTRIARESSAPVDFLTGTDPDALNYSSGVFSSPNPDAKVVRLETKGDLVGLTGTLQDLITQFLAQVRVVLLGGDAKDLQRVTNASVRTLFLDALAKNEVLRDSYTSALRSMCRIALQIGFLLGEVPSFPDDREIHVWLASPLPVDKTENANVVALGLAGGYMSKRSAAEYMELDWEFEKANIESDVQDDLTKKKRYATLINESSINSPLENGNSSGGAQTRPSGSGE